MGTHLLRRYVPDWKVCPRLEGMFPVGGGLGGSKNEVVFWPGLKFSM